MCSELQLETIVDPGNGSAYTCKATISDLIGISCGSSSHASSVGQSPQSHYPTFPDVHTDVIIREVIILAGL